MSTGSIKPPLEPCGMTAAEIAAALHGRKCGHGWMALCIAHEERAPSLSIDERDGKVLVKCFAGCEQAAVIAALRERRLWPDRGKQQDRDTEAIYTYTDENGALLYQVVRKRGKKFLQRRPDGSGGWIWKKH